MSPSRRIAPPRPTRAEWLAARAALASRRTRRFAVVAVGVFAVVLVALVATGTGRPAPRAPLPPREDTLALRRALDSATVQATLADTGYVGSLQAAEAVEAMAASLPQDQRRKRDSVQQAAAMLDVLLDQAERFPLPRSYRLMAESRALRNTVGTRALLDSLSRLEALRDRLDPAAVETSRRFAALTEAINGVGAALRVTALRRRGEMRGELVVLAGGDVATLRDTADARARRDQARTGVDSLSRALQGVRQRVHARDSVETRRQAEVASRIPPTATLIGALVLSLVAGFAVTLATEIGRPTVAHAREAEHAAKAPVLATVLPPAAPRSRLTRDVAFTGLDPFRMLYLGLTATGTRTGTVVITGDDPRVVGVVVARLAAAAAADARAALVIDADPLTSTLAARFRVAEEPGFSDAVAGVQLWRDVARLTSARDAGRVEVIAAGSSRRQLPDAAQLERSRLEFFAFRAQYDFAVFAAPSRAAVESLATGLLPHPPVVVCATVGVTSLPVLRATSAWVEDIAELHGVLLWDAPIGNSMGTS